MMPSCPRRKVCLFPFTPLSLILSFAKSAEISRAAKIVHEMKLSHQSNRGAFGLDLSDGQGGKEMIDAPMLKQAQNVLRAAQAAGKSISIS